MRRFLRDNGLTITLVALFLLAWLVGQVTAGHLEDNENRRDHGRAAVNLGTILGSSHFLEATMENWESEFLQMFVYVVLTAFLYQRGSSESKDPDKEEEVVDEDPATARDRPDAPWPVRKGGWILKLYSCSLSLAFLLLFLVALGLHAGGGVGEYNQDQLAHGGETMTLLEYMGTARFWFESFQNWQSEFLSMALMVALTIWLRQKGSPESKPVASPHSATVR